MDYDKRVLVRFACAIIFLNIIMLIAFAGFNTLTEDIQKDIINETLMENTIYTILDKNEVSRHIITESKTQLSIVVEEADTKKRYYIELENTHKSNGIYEKFAVLTAGDRFMYEGNNIQLVE